MTLESQMKKIEKTFTSLKAEVQLGKLSPKKKRKGIKELRQQEKEEKEGLKQEYERMLYLLSQAKDYAEMLNIELTEALSLLAYREIDKLHWDFHQLTLSKK